MKITTFSVVVGTAACDAHCPFCISHQTGFDQLREADSVHVRNFQKAIQLATRAGCTTVLLTGKGEPTLYPDQINDYLLHLGDKFPLVQLQTNAIRIGEIAKVWAEHRDSGEPSTALEQSIRGLSPQHWNLFCGIRKWVNDGLDTIAISVVDVDADQNRRVYLRHRDATYPDLATTVSFLRQFGYTVRLCVMMCSPFVDSPVDIRRIVAWCKRNDVHQLTMRPVRRVAVGDDLAARWVDVHGLSPAQERSISEHVAEEGTHILTIGEGEHAFKVYDYDGQNLGMPDCLTVDLSDIRTLIFFANGTVSWDWQYKGACLLGGRAGGK